MPTLHPQHRDRPLLDPARRTDGALSAALAPVGLDRSPREVPDRAPAWRSAPGDFSAMERFTRTVSVTRRFDRRQIVIQKGDAGSSVYVVRSGLVKVTAPSLDGKEITFAYLGKQEFFGETAVLEGAAHTATVTAVEPTVLQIIDRREFLDMIERHPDAALALAANLCARLRRASELAEDISFLDVSARLAKTLLHLVDRHGIPAPAGVRIGFPLCQQELANLVATTRESINKHLRNWQEEGLLSITGGTLTILQLSELKKMVPA